MLSELKVSNFAIIDNIHVTFKNGFNVLSGETGSGKSVLLKSLALLMGEKSLTDTIQHGAAQATVEGLFDITQRKDIAERLTNSGIELIDGSLIVKRIISSDGKNRVYINGSLSTLQQLRDVVSPLIELTGHQAPLIELTGQHENRHLQSRSYHLEALDQYIGAVALRNTVEKLFHEHANVENELLRLKNDLKSKEQRLDFLTYQRDEIKNLNLKPGDEDSLQNELIFLKDSSRITQFLNEAETALYSDDDSALVRIHRILQRGLEFSSLDTKFKEKLDTLQQAKSLLEDCVYEFRDMGQKMSSSPEHLESIEEKLSALRKLQKKYGITVAEILENLTTIEEEIQTLENSEENVSQLENKSTALMKNLKEQSRELHKIRVGGAKTLAKSVNSELSDLNMKGLIFNVRVDENTNGLTATGISDVEFMIQSSKSDVARSLSKFASGGELSRILLSLKRVVGASEYPRTYLFDEVDAGVSGVTAEKVGRKLKSIAKGQQVICVTHLPQVAAFASAHYVIQKSQVGNGIKMTVDALSSAEQVKEIARMLSGEKITKSSLAHAKELLSN
jgi:DNA repair protein RecN (Recombination protein N)